MLDKGLIHVTKERVIGKVNVIVPYFDIPKLAEVVYLGKPAITPLVIYLLGHDLYHSDKTVPYKYNANML